LGMLIAALAKSIKQANDLSTMLTLILAAIGGAIPVSWPPIFRSEGFIGTLSNLTPQAHAVQAYFKLVGENAPFEQILPHVGILLAMSVVFFVIAVRRFKFE
jgi:ABC-type multidrug transport system permease subunit